MLKGQYLPYQVIYTASDKSAKKDNDQMNDKIDTSVIYITEFKRVS